MKQAKQVSKFLNVSVKKFSKTDKAFKGACEVLALAPSAKGDGIVLHDDFSQHLATLDKLQKNEEVSAKAAAMCFVRFASKNGAEHVLFTGLGKDKEGINAQGAAERFRRLGALVCQKLAAEKVKAAVVHLDSFLMSQAQLDVDAEVAAYAFSEGFGLASYKFEKYFTKKGKNEIEPISLTLMSSQASRVSAYERGVEMAQALVLGVEVCRDFGNEPSNELYPVEYSKRVKAMASHYGLKFKELDEKTMAKEGMGLLLGVGQGSVKPPRLMVVEYNPSGAAKKHKTIAFVGKGITFDSGGISIKPSAKMEEMKYDMCGSAAVIGAVVACAQLQVKTRVIGVIAAAENMPDGNAINPGNILRARNGKTVEIVNTDAEGRLVLADALDYTQDMKPDYIIDLATLTGAVTITLGKACAGLMGNDEEFNRLVHKAAKDSGERVWELPLFDEYFDDLRSEYADMRNSGDSPSHGTAKGAMFLQQFIRKDTRWAHLDIAAVAMGVSNVPYYPKRAGTGYGVRLLVELARGLGM